ncbi:MerR family transcriptional regulator [Tenggerimyces flavus]|uniref:MerR family transcriptional regulator n=1 Tax=Tenggerimyces flavus TaxID=1708749 RepID=A0ABV7Y5K0_9ACTN|nr:MerR family transcriptional regulator [Tenggerimyces flavus]MBM7788398.1 DNA-binding transcriptional MerR regulator [Tenggerimyces flavus]
MRIGELARRAGVSERLLRYYEEQSLLHPSRLPSGYRSYAESDVLAVGRIRTLLGVGLSTATIAELLPCLTGSEHLIPTCAVLLEKLQEERARITDTIAALEGSRSLLDNVLAAAPAELS